MILFRMETKLSETKRKMCFSKESLKQKDDEVNKTTLKVEEIQKEANAREEN